MKNSVGNYSSLPVRRARSSGFTLIELLVVIAIIAILASILFPVFGRARENARRSACQSNLKQIGLGIMQYTQDYDETFPGATMGYGGAGCAGTGNGEYVANCMKWMDLTQPYIKSTQIFDCPSDSAPNGRYQLPAALNPTNPRTTRAFGSYSTNMGYWGVANAAGPITTYSSYGASLSAVASPATTIMIADASNPNESTPYFYAGTSTNNFTVGTVNGVNVVRGYGGGVVNNGPIERHLETSNILFADGHVKSLKVTSLMTPSTVAPNVGLKSLFTNADD
jgi:prepilin-type N-terminal cleavage/methylation domain-containing protein/prepilin-type processing-associated H-X9-DG protein